MTDGAGRTAAGPVSGAGRYAFGVVLAALRWAAVVAAVLVWIVVVPAVELARAAWARLTARTQGSDLDDVSPGGAGAAAAPAEEPVALRGDEADGDAADRVRTLTA